MFRGEQRPFSELIAFDFLSGPDDPKPGTVKSTVKKPTTRKDPKKETVLLPKSIIPGTKKLKDPISNCVFLEKSMHALNSFFSALETTDSEVAILYGSIYDKVRITMKNLGPKDKDASKDSKDGKDSKEKSSPGLEKTYPSTGGQHLDQSVKAWEQFRELLQLLVIKHKSLDNL